MEGEKDAPLISVVICTYNRAWVLRECLQSLDEQTLPKSSYEVIVVNNGSTDETQSVAGEFAGRYPNILSLIEPQHGSSIARNRGWQAARGEYVAFIDDDARAYPDWLEAIASFAHRRPEVTVFGGPYEAYSVVPVPQWFPLEHFTLWQGDQERPLRPHQEHLSGTNLIVKKHMFKYAQFNHHVGPKAEKFSYGEETRLLEEFYGQGVLVFYVPTVKVRHLVHERKMHLRYLLWSAYTVGRSYIGAFGRRRSLLSHIRGLVLQCVNLFVNLLSFQSMPVKQRVFYACDGLFGEIGAFMAYLASLGGRAA